jgi:peptidoglycan/LPS O-acetylase OafA/YrhL
MIATVLEWRPLRYTGRVSYGLYLWHFPVFAVVRSHFDLPGLVEVMALVGLSYAVAALSFVFIEQPFLRLKRRFAPVDRALVSAP